MTTAPISLQDLRRSLYVKAKAETVLAFLGTIRPRLQDGDLAEAYQMARSNNGAPELTGSRSKPSKKAERRVFSCRFGMNWSPTRIGHGGTEEGDSKGWGQESPRPVDSRNP